MIRHPVFKALAVFFCALSLSAAVLTGGGVLLLQSQSLYRNTPQEMVRNRQEEIAREAAEYLLKHFYICELAQMPPEIAEDPWLYEGKYQVQELLQSGRIYYRIEAENGELFQDAIPQGMDAKLQTFDRIELELFSQYPVLTPYEPEGQEGTSDPAPLPRDRQDRYLYSDVWQLYSGKSYQVDLYQGPPARVTIYLEPNVWRMNAPYSWESCMILYPRRYQLLGILSACGALSLLMLVFLGLTAGRQPGQQAPALRGLNRLPLDLYGLVLAAEAVLGFPLIVGLYREAVRGELGAGLALSGALAFVMVLPWIGFFTAWMAQLKCRCCLKTTLLGRFLCWSWRWGRRLFGLLPLIWRWAAIILTLIALLVLSLLMASAYGRGPWLIPAIASFLLLTGVLLYGGYAMGTLYQGARRMGSGDLTRKIDTHHLRGSFLDFANQLNSLADVSVQAAREQLKSERMKTELITNVSHDIKTPLTSIINYVDLLQRAASEEQRQQYLEVLSRQSQRLKKLIEDLMEMSKASTGNLTVELTRVDVTEAVNQALGEYADKLDALPLTVVFRPPDAPAMILADGRLLWRTLSNLLQNICKYAMPGTRLYVDVIRDRQDVVVCMKNISREELNISAEELMERFVRGDRSRNTEGSGLGLNIARSLMELQGGRLELMVEGDLFRACLIFPAHETDS